MDYGARLKRFILQAKTTPNALAKKVALDPTTIYKIVNNDSKPSLPSLERICDALGITMAEFFADEVQTKAEAYTYDQLVEAINCRDLPAEQKNSTLWFLKENRDAVLPLVIKNAVLVDGEIHIELVNDIAELVKNYQSLPPKQQEALKLVAEAFASAHRHKQPEARGC
jgi:Predicted transcriptional regulators